jgi:Sulfotransferase family
VPNRGPSGTVSQAPPSFRLGGPGGLPWDPAYHAPMADPILVTGAHRSGTTWVGKMLSLSPQVAYVHEPFSPLRSPGWLGMRIPTWYLYVCGDNEERYIPAVRRLLALRYPLGADLRSAPRPRVIGQIALEWPRSLAARSRRSRPLLKDPIAVFSAEWLADRFRALPVVLVRHPAAFAGSLKRLDWRFDFQNWSEQPFLIRDHLGRYEDRIREYASTPPDLIDQAILMWNSIHLVIDGYRDRHPDWTFLRYEDLAASPVEGFADLARRLGTPWDERTEAEVLRFSSDRNVKEVPAWQHRRVKRDSRAAMTTWVHRLTEEERERVREGTAEVAARFYTDADWAPEEVRS